MSESLNHEYTKKFHTNVKWLALNFFIRNVPF